MNISSLRRVVFAAVLSCSVVTAYSLLRYPGILVPLQVGLLYASVLVVVLLIYLIVAWRLTSKDESDSIWIARQGLNWGILIAFF